jgi:LuxR family transcriptional regulator, quorum-sensing system regulator BjaR1
MKVLKTHLPKVINELLLEQTVDDVLDRMKRDLREVGVEHFGIFRFTYAGLPLEKWRLGKRAPQMFEKHVYKGDFHDSPVSRHCRRVVEPFFWYDTPPLDAPDVERFKRAKEAGVPEALVVPVPGPRGAIGIGWFASATNSRVELLKHLFAIETVCIAGFYRLKDLVAPPEEPPQGRLSKREQEILGRVAEGMSSEEIGDMLHISDRTVDWHVSKAMDRLQAKNRVQAVVLAMQKGALTI